MRTRHVRHSTAPRGRCTRLPRTVAQGHSAGLDHVLMHGTVPDFTRLVSFLGAKKGQILDTGLIYDELPPGLLTKVLMLASPPAPGRARHNRRGRHNDCLTARASTLLQARPDSCWCCIVIVLFIFCIVVDRDTCTRSQSEEGQDGRGGHHRRSRCSVLNESHCRSRGRRRRRLKKKGVTTRSSSLPPRLSPRFPFRCVGS